MTPWQALHDGLARCCSMISRTERAFSPSLFSLNPSTSGGGAAGGVPSDVLQNPGAAQHRRRAIGVRRRHQHAALAEQPPAIRVGERDAAEPLAAHVRNPVVQRQPLVDEGVVRRQQIEHAAVLAQDAVRRTARSRCGTPRAGRRRSWERPRHPDRCCRSPRTFSHWNAKLVTSDFDFGIGQQPPHLRLEHLGVGEPALLGHVEQFVVRQAGPRGRTPGATRDRDR